MATEALVTHRGVMLTTLFCPACRHEWSEHPLGRRGRDADRSPRDCASRISDRRRPIACRRRTARIARPTRTCTAFAAPPSEVYFACDGCEAMWVLRASTTEHASPPARSRGNILFVSDNPLTAPWAGPYGGVPPWDRMAPEHFPGAFAAAIAEQRSEIDAIAANPEAADLRKHASPPWSARAARSIASSACSAWRARTSPTPSIRRSSASGSRSSPRPPTTSCSTKGCSSGLKPSTRRCRRRVSNPIRCGSSRACTSTSCGAARG